MTVRSNRRAFRLGPAQVLVEPRHDLDEIARAVPIIELMHQNFVPGVLAGARRTGQAKNIGRASDAGGGARLDRRSADFLETDHQKQRREAVHLFFEQRLDRFGGDVAAGKSGAAGRDDDVDHRISDPGLYAGADGLDIVMDEAALGDEMPGRDDSLHQKSARFVVLHRARVGYRQHRELERYELPALIDPSHGYTFTQLSLDHFRAGGKSLPTVSSPTACCRPRAARN